VSRRKIEVHSEKKHRLKDEFMNRIQEKKKKKDPFPPRGKDVSNVTSEEGEIFMRASKKGEQGGRLRGNKKGLYSGKAEEEDRNGRHSEQEKRVLYFLAMARLYTVPPSKGSATFKMRYGRKKKANLVNRRLPLPV